jgi:hypothetical protein
VIFFQTNFLPFFTHLYSIPKLVAIFPTCLQVAPALIAPKEGAVTKRSDPTTKNESSGKRRKARP